MGSGGGGGGGEEEKVRRMGKEKEHEKEEEGRKTTSILLFGCRIEIRVVGSDNDTLKEEYSASSSSSRHDPSAFEIKNKKERRPAAKGGRRKKARADNLSKPVLVPPPHAGGWDGALREIGAMDVTFICTKGLTDSDVEQQQNRLLLPKPCVRQHLLGFLTEAEKVRLTNREGIPAVVVDAEGRQWNTSLNYWKSSQSYNLNGDWWKLVQTCGLSSAHHCVEVRAFRHGGEQRCLGFVALHQDNSHAR